MTEDHPYVAWLKQRYASGEIEMDELEERLELGLRAEAGELVAFPSEYATRLSQTDAPGGVITYRQVFKEVWLQAGGR